MELRASEWIVIAYFAYLAGAAAAMRSIGRQPRLRVIATAIIVLIAVLTIARFGTSAMLWREWMPLVYIVIGYRLPALLVTRTNQAFEVWLLSLDRRWRVTQNSARAPGLVLELCTRSRTGFGPRCSWRCLGATAFFHGSPPGRRARLKVRRCFRRGRSGGSTCECSVSRAFS